MLDHKSMFGEHFKHIFVLTALAWMTYTLPAVQAAFQSAQANTDLPNNVAAISVSVAAVTYPKDTSSRVKFPAGYTCYPNPVPSGGLSARVDTKPSLNLVYDANKKEASLVATFKVTVDGGKKGGYVNEEGSYIGFLNQINSYVSANSQRTGPLLPISKVNTVVDTHGQKVFVIPPNKKVQFQVIGTVDPKQLFAGTYYAKLDVIIGTDLTNGFKISVDSNQTNSKTIVGEVTPYILQIKNANPITPGQEVTLIGQRLSGVSLSIDGTYVSVPASTASNDGQYIFILPNITDGWHWLNVQNANGSSNSIGFQVQNPVPVATITATMNSSSPLNRIVTVSSVEGTGYVAMAVFDLKSQGGNATLRGLNINLNTYGRDPSTIFSDVKIKAGGLIYSANSIGALTSFTDVNIPLPQDVYVPITVFVDIVKNVNGALNGATTSVSLTANDTNVVAENASFVKVAVNPAQLNGSLVTLSDSDVAVSNTSTSVTPIIGPLGTTAYSVKYKFTLTAGDNTLYLSPTASIVTMVAPISLSITGVTTVVSPANLSGDSSQALIVPAGSSREFTVSGTVSGASGASGLVSINSIMYGASSSDTNSSQITSGLSSLKTLIVIP